MLYREQLRFKGYWMGVLAWLVISIFAPASAALSQSEDGWLRLCSAQGATWVLAADQPQGPSAAECHCLFGVLPQATGGALLLADGDRFLPNLSYSSVTLSRAYSLCQPRSPPVLS
jgi:hypothetical protein